MYQGKTILAIITARGGSKGIPKKNIKLLGGKPLICWTIDAALKCPYIDRLILSSDDPEIIEISKRAGCEVPFTRPKQLAEDHTSSMDVILHAVAQVKDEYDYILLLQPTSPFRTSQNIIDIIEQTIEKKSKMTVSVTKLKKHPSFMYSITDGYLKSFIPAYQQLRRQDMPEAYEHNGALYLAETQYLLKEKSYCSSLAQPFVMNSRESLDIDEMDDWEYAEYVLHKE